ncbi:MAG TPA: hypothetical protein VKA83_18880 [Methylomirabilota bacterium]|nr:hypothetical protein [Methylomirabilota bacterium]
MRRPRTHAFWVMALAVGLVVLLRLLAHACPADPSWIAGLYDDADFDDVIQHVLSSGAVAPAAPPVDARALRYLHLVAAYTAGSPAATVRSASPTRAPPVRLALSI